MIVRTISGCKVGWEVYDDEEEARDRAVQARADASRMQGQGYDFGFQIPGQVERTKDGMWRVVIP